MEHQVELKRAYDAATADDGFRIYIDRLWPRGLSHETFHYDLWDKDIAPSTELREWFHAAPEERWEEFARRYAAELKGSPAFAALLETVLPHTIGPSILPQATRRQAAITAARAVARRVRAEHA